MLCGKLTKKRTRNTRVPLANNFILTTMTDC
jgi:hypothetical protein